MWAEYGRISGSARGNTAMRFSGGTDLVQYCVYKEWKPEPSLMWLAAKDYRYVLASSEMTGSKQQLGLGVGMAAGRPSWYKREEWKTRGVGNDLALITDLSLGLTIRIYAGYCRSQSLNELTFLLILPIELFAKDALFLKKYIFMTFFCLIGRYSLWDLFKHLFNIEL